jgi:hypothetical protein
VEQCYEYSTTSTKYGIYYQLKLDACNGGGQVLYDKGGGTVDLTSTFYLLANTINL